MLTEVNKPRKLNSSYNLGRMSWKKGALFLYMICSASTIRGMVLENLNEPENDLQMPVEVLDGKLMFFFYYL